MSTDRDPRASEAWKARARAQDLAWAQGRPYHEPINDECCPDFSCCEPQLFEADEAKRWDAYRRAHGLDN